MGTLDVPLRPCPSEERFHDPVDQNRLGADAQTEPYSGMPIVLGAKPPQRAQHQPDQPEVTELGRGEEDAVGHGIAADAVERAVNGVVETADAVAEHPPTLGQLAMAAGGRASCGLPPNAGQ